MISAFRKIWNFAGEEKKNINRSVLVCFFNAVFHMFEVGAVYTVLRAMAEGERGGAAAWIALLCMVISILGGALTGGVSQLMQTHAGYFMTANERITIGNRLKSVPMGFFNEKQPGRSDWCLHDGSGVDREHGADGFGQYPGRADRNSRIYTDDFAF